MKPAHLIVLSILAGKHKFGKGGDYDPVLHQAFKNIPLTNIYRHFTASLFTLETPVELSFPHLPNHAFTEGWDYQLNIPRNAYHHPGWNHSGSFYFERIDWEQHFDFREIYKTLGKTYEYGKWEPWQPLPAVVSPLYHRLYHIRDIEDLYVYNQQRLTKNVWKALDVGQRITAYMNWYTSGNFQSYLFKLPDTLTIRVSSDMNKTPLIQLDEYRVIKSENRNNSSVIDNFYSAKFSFIPDSGYELLIKSSHPDFYVNFYEITYAT